MKFYTRTIDDLGRVIIPAEVRKLIGIQYGDPLTFTIVPKGVAIQTKEPMVVLNTAEALANGMERRLKEMEDNTP